MSTQIMIQQIDEQLRDLSSERVAVVWQLVKMLGTSSSSQKKSRRAVLDVDAFLTWQRKSRAKDLELDSSRNIRLEDSIIAI